MRKIVLESRKTKNQRINKVANHSQWTENKKMN